MDKGILLGTTTFVEFICYYIRELSRDVFLVCHDRT